VRPPLERLTITAKDREDDRHHRAHNARGRDRLTPSPELFPFESQWFDSGAGRIHYVDEGAGQPILMLHGNPTWSFLYRRVIEELGGQFRCVAVDLPGFGLSDRPAGYGYTPAEQAAVVGELLRELDLRDLIVMAHDWGGPIGLSAAAAAPQRAFGLVLGNTWFWPADRRAGLFSRVMSAGRCSGRSSAATCSSSGSCRRESFAT
jgi:haloalkane dehalogenase